jgi:hypothetical protein
MMQLHAIFLLLACVSAQKEKHASKTETQTVPRGPVGKKLSLFILLLIDETIELRFKDRVIFVRPSAFLMRRGVRKI